MPLNATFSNTEQLNAVFAQPHTLGAELGSTVYVPVIDDYVGPYEIVPSDEAQVIHCDALRMRDNLTIDPIPSNYGKITWNGAYLTVS